MGKINITDLVTLRKTLQEKIEKLDSKFETEVERIRKRYNHDKLELSSSIIIVDEAINSYSNAVVDNSSLDVNFIGNHIANLMSRYEGVSYTFQESTYTTLKPTIWDKVKARVNEHVLIVIQDKEIEEEYEKSPFKEFKDLINLEKKQKVLILYRSNYKDNGVINFYSSDFETTEPYIKETVNFNGFDYVKDFVDRVISYRLDNTVLFIPDNAIEEIKGKILSKPSRTLIKTPKQP